MLRTGRGWEDPVVLWTGTPRLRLRVEVVLINTGNGDESKLRGRHPAPFVTDRSQVPTPTVDTLRAVSVWVGKARVDCNQSSRKSTDLQTFGRRV